MTPPRRSMSATSAAPARKPASSRGITICPLIPQKPTILSADRRAERRSEIHGILVQFPLPGHINENAIIERIDPIKDVDGFHPVHGRPARPAHPGPAAMHAARHHDDAEPDRRSTRRAVTPSSSAHRTTSAARWRSSSCWPARRRPSAIGLPGTCGRTSNGPTSWPSRSARRT